MHSLVITSRSHSKCTTCLQLALKIRLQKPTWGLAQPVMLSVLVNETQDCTTEPITGSLLSSNSQQLLCTGFIPSQDIFQVMLLQMPDRINRECVWGSLAEKSWEKSRCGPRTPYTHTHTRARKHTHMCLFDKSMHPVSSVTICLTKLTTTLSHWERARKVWVLTASGLERERKKKKRGSAICVTFLFLKQTS